MSHWTEIQTQVKSLEAARAACRELGVALLTPAPGQKVFARGYAGNTHPGDAMIKLSGPYDVALTRQADGSYSLTCDYYKGHVAAQLGDKCQRFNQLTAVHQATIAARQKGYAVRRVQGSNGSINLVLSVP